MRFSVGVCYNIAMHILVVEDDARIAGFVADGFRRDGHAVTCAADGEEGLYFAQSGSFDAIVLDILLPKLNGLEVLRRLRGSGSKVPIIVLSARGSVESKVEGLEAGADDYLAKPFSIVELLARVQALVRRAAGGGACGELSVADLRLDLISHRVVRGARRIELQPLEYRLLEYLMRNRGRIVSRTMIMDRVWDYAFDPHTNVVESRVSRLRAKLTRPGEKELLHTVRGFGYVLEER